MCAAPITAEDCCSAELSSAATRVGALSLGGALPFWLLLLSLNRFAFQSSKERKRSSSTGSSGVRGLRQQMGSSRRLGARMAMAWNGSYGVVDGGRTASTEDASSRQRSEVGSQDKRVLNITRGNDRHPSGCTGAKQARSASHFRFILIWPRQTRAHTHSFLYIISLRNWKSTEKNIY